MVNTSGLALQNPSLWLLVANILNPTPITPTASKIFIQKFLEGSLHSKVTCASQTMEFYQYVLFL